MASERWPTRLTNEDIQKCQVSKSCECVIRNGRDAVIRQVPTNRVQFEKRTYAFYTTYSESKLLSPANVRFRMVVILFPDSDLQSEVGLFHGKVRKPHRRSQGSQLAESCECATRNKNDLVVGQVSVEEQSRGVNQSTVHRR